MESKITALWNAHSPTGKWSLIWLAVHLAAIAAITLLNPGNRPALIRLTVSGLAVDLSYTLALIGRREKIAAVGLCVIMTADFHLSVIVNYAQKDGGHNSLIIISLVVLIMAKHLLGLRGLATFTGAGILILFLGQAQYNPTQYLGVVTYPIAATGIYLLLEWRDHVQRKDRGTIHRFTERNGRVDIQLDTHRGYRLQVRISRVYWTRLGLGRGDYIVIERGENRAENGQQYIQAFSIKVDRTQE